MKATNNAETEFAMGREPTEMSRPAEGRISDDASESTVSISAGASSRSQEVK
jgi:hypothetical protein